MRTTPISDRLQIGIFGKRNSGKSSFINVFTEQNVAIVSDTPGTTTDPVGKAIEIRGLGPVYLYDTAGIDDSGELGHKRIEKTKAILNKINLALIITTAETFDNTEEKLIQELQQRQIPFVVLFNKSDLFGEQKNKNDFLSVSISCKTKQGIKEARNLIIKEGGKIHPQKDTIIGDIISQGDFIFLVVPIDLGAPKGRLILPQVQTIRDILDNDAVSVVVKERELEYALGRTKPNLVICDSQVVLKVVGDLSPDIKMTTFSIIFSRLKGDLAEFVKNVKVLDSLEDGDSILLLEACTHHSLEDDIARVKIPRWVREYTGKNIKFDINPGPFVNKNLSDYKLLVHCGGCMINRQEYIHRVHQSIEKQIPMTNYGVLISYVHGVLKRALSPFPYELSLLEN